jgi:HlyD family secretion protein
MIKRIFKIFLLAAMLVLFLGTGVYLYKKSDAAPVVFQTDTLFTATIIKKTVATGSIVPRKEIAVKPRVSGIVEDVYVQPGQIVKQGQLIAKIKIVPNIVNLNSAESSLSRAEINLTEADRELKRQEKLYKEQVISDAEYNQSLSKYKLAKEDKESADNNLQLVKDGASKKSGQVSNLIYATSDGMLLDVPVKKGNSVIESNNFNEGTTIATIADMNSLMFKGNIDESEAGKIKEGMDINIIIAAMEGQTFNAKLEYIAPKGTDVQGAIQFEVRAGVKQNAKNMIRAGYSANADIVLAKKENVTVIRESNLLFDKGKPYVEVEQTPQVFKKKMIKTGLSDGINIEIVEGLSKTDKIKQQENNKGNKGMPAKA